MIGLPQSSDHLSFHEVPTAIATCAVHTLVIQCAQIFSILHEEAALGQVTAAHYTEHTHKKNLYRSCRAVQQFRLHPAPTSSFNLILSANHTCSFTL